MKPARLPLITLACLGLGFIGFTYFSSPSAGSFLVTNVTPTSATATWYATQPSFGCLLLFRFPPQVTCDRRQNHHLTLAGLQPHTSYTALALTQLQPRLLTWTTAVIPDVPPLPPNPAYGRVLLPGGLIPAPFATVIAYTKTGPVSSLTTATGYWTIDLPPDYTSAETIPVTIFWGNRLSYWHLIRPGFHQPVADFVLRLTPKN